MDPIENQQVFINEIPTIEDIVYEPIEKAARNVALISTCIILIIIFIGLFAGVRTVDEEEKKILYTGFGIVTLLFGFIIVLTIMGHKKKMYAVRPYDIHYKKGVLWKSHTSIPYNRVQHCEVNQGPLDRMFNISKLKIFTAGGSSSDLTIPGLSPENAEKIKTFVLNKMSHDEE